MTIAGWEVVAELSLRLLYTDYKDHPRLTVFRVKGTTCVCCGAGKEGVRLVKRAENKNGNLHVDIVTKGGRLMTVDHIVAKSVAKKLGWKGRQIESLDNKQPMCERCNGKKGHKEINLDELQAMLGVKKVSLV